MLKSRKPERRDLGPPVEALEDRRLFSTILVTPLADSGTGSLRAAVAQADLDHSADTIQFQSGLSGTVGLSTIGNTAFGASALLVTNTITIIEPATSGGITIGRTIGAPSMRLFAISSAGNLTLDNVALSGGIAQGGAGGSGGGGGGGGGAGLGGAIFSQGQLTINNSTFTNNQAVGGVGGVGIANLSYGGSGGGGMGSAGQAGSASGAGGCDEGTGRGGRRAERRRAGDGERRRRERRIWRRRRRRPVGIDQYEDSSRRQW